MAPPTEIPIKVLPNPSAEPLARESAVEEAHNDGSSEPESYARSSKKGHRARRS